MANRDSSDIEPAKRVRPVRGVVVFLLVVAPFVLLATAWGRTTRRSYCAVFFMPSGAVQGFATHGGRLVVALSNLSFGRERGLTMLTDGLAPVEFDETFRTVYTDVPDKHERWGFGYAAGHPVDPAAQGVDAASHVAVVFPLWLAVATAAIPPARLATRGLRRWRRWRSGGCLVCGYDLRGSEDRCPECGTPFVSTNNTNGAST